MFKGFLALFRLILRRDRIKLPLWILGITTSLVSMVPLLKDTYAEQSNLDALYGSFARNAASLFLTGPMDKPSFGGLMTIETYIWWGLAVAFMNTLLIVRHTRLNEEMGAQELMLSGQVHRHATLTTALTTAVIVNVLVAVGIGAGLSSLEGSWGSGAWLYGFSMGLFGFAWAVIAAIVVQLVQSTRTANGMLAGLIGMTFVLRGVGNVTGAVSADGILQPSWVSWLSPFGWLQATRPLTFPEWWPLLVPVVFATVAVPVAYWLLGKRDVGAGVLPQRKGRARASRVLRTSLGFTWRLQRNIFFGWLVGSLAMATTIGVLIPELDSVYGESESARQLVESMGGAGAMVPAFLSAMISITAIMVLAAVAQGMSKLGVEESSAHLESLLATKLPRVKWAVLHMLIVLGGGAVMLAATGATIEVFVSAETDIPLEAGEYIVAALTYFPVLALFAGIYVLLLGVVPRMASVVAWTLFGYVAFMTWLGPFLKLEQWIMDLSPMSHIAAAPAQETELMPLVIMSAISLVLLVIGLVLFRRRDIQTS